MKPIIAIQALSKTYESGHRALNNITLDIHEGEILALLGPNGAGKTTLISTICGIVSPTEGSVTVDGYDIIADFRQTRKLIGLVPQELTLGAFETVWNSVSFSRGLFGQKKNPEFLEELLKSLTLWDKQNAELRTLSGGMKRRVLIAKALSHEPRILFLDEPTAGVDVELRRDMWNIVRRLRETGVTVILTTHYIEEAEAIADRIGIINNGELLLVEDKHDLMQKLGKKQLIINLKQPAHSLPGTLSEFNLELSVDGSKLVYSYDSQGDETGITALLKAIQESPDLALKDLDTTQSSLEEIFVNLLREDR